MKGSLIILIVLVVIVLVVILMTSPTCRNAVTGVFKGRPKVESKQKPVQAPAPGPVVEQVAQPIVNGKVGVRAEMPDAKPFVNGKVLPPAPKAAIPIAAEAPKAVQAPAKLLTGNLFEILDPSVDVQAEYGISEGELDALAQKYKEKHLDTSKPEIIRSRHVTRSGLENAERVARQSYISVAGTGKRGDYEQFYTEVLRDRLIPESGDTKIKTRAKRRK